VGQLLLCKKEKQESGHSFKLMTCFVCTLSHLSFILSSMALQPYACSGLYWFLNQLFRRSVWPLDEWSARRYTGQHNKHRPRTNVHVLRVFEYTIWRTSTHGLRHRTRCRWVGCHMFLPQPAEWMIMAWTTRFGSQQRQETFLHATAPRPPLRSTQLPVKWVK
jgi:hypothetical protein